MGLVETSIGKMVPIMPGEVREEDPLLCWAETYNTLIVDGDAFRLPVPEVQDLYPVSPIAPWVDRKLYIHNMGHAAAAYLGFLNNPKADYIWEVLESTAVIDQVRTAMSCSAEALASAYPASFSRRELSAHVDDLLARFRNRALGDTVYRVGRDLPRKLSREDRIVGAIETALRQGIDPTPIVDVFHAAPHFAKPGPDGTLFPSDAEFARQFAQQGEEWLLHQVVGVGSDETELRSVLTKGADRRELRR
jgi:mannitol-1-phosphate 5-dehydrogenase